jgi:hypothetical protein
MINIINPLSDLYLDSCGGGCLGQVVKWGKISPFVGELKASPKKTLKNNP